MDGFGNKILQLGAIVKISETMIKRILARPTLEADEFVKFQVFSNKIFSSDPDISIFRPL